MRIMFLGTSSGAGKTTIAAMYCRHLASKGVDVAPFKALNLSLNSFAAADGGEIGMGQAFQAWACGLEPETRMNPVLLKPSGGRMQIVLRGRPYTETDKGGPALTEETVRAALECYDSLTSDHEAVVCEGSGSPAEINIADKDVANMRMVRERSIPAVLVGDIERGGVFASLYGTWRLIPEKDRHLIRGFIINRFRGDATILKKGIERIEELTGMKYLGVMPYLDLRFPEEDTLSDKGGRLEGADPRSAFLANLDEFLGVAEGTLDLEAMDEISSA
jgi:adenosylcobyric acid synthase